MEKYPLRKSSLNIMKMGILIFAFLMSFAFGSAFNSNFDVEVLASEYMNNVMNEIRRLNHKVAEMLWNYNSNRADENFAVYKEASTKLSEFMKEVRDQIQLFNWPSFKSSDLRAQFRSLTPKDYDTLEDNDYEEYLNVSSTLQRNFGEVKLCDFSNKANCDLSFNPELKEIFANSRNPEELAYYWRQFYDKAGTTVRGPFEKYIELNTKAAQLNNFTSGAEIWLHEYGDNMEDQLDELFDDIDPLYQELHAYVRHRLQKFYGESVVSSQGPIPMHLLGNLWAQEWNNIIDIIIPFPEKPAINVTGEMVKQGYTQLKMYQMGDDFFTSMNLTKLTSTFWVKSIIEKPKDGRDFLCREPTTRDLYEKDDVRIKFCPRINQEDFIALHHELGHIQYFLQYQDQPYIYRQGPNSGFHEAVADLIGLSVSTPKHLERIGLLKNYVYDEEARINRLLLTALYKIVVLPMFLSMDKYRFDLFRGQIKKAQWNCEFWKMREEYSGIEPPIIRSESDFDPPAQMHFSFDDDLLRYFVAYIIQFQFYKAACIKAGQYDPNNPELPLDNCDFYGSLEVGKAFHDMLSLGSSKPWQDAMEVFTGERKMSGQAIAEYFEPLRIWLEAENKKNNVHIGWSASEKCVKKIRKIGKLERFV